VEVVEYSLSESQRRGGKAGLIRIAAATSLTGTTFSSIITLFLLRLGASPLQIGLLATFRQLAVLSQMWGLQLMPKVGKARFGGIARASSLPAAVFVIALACSGMTGTAAIWLTIGTFAVWEMLNSIASLAWWPLIQDNTAGDAVGEFFARLRTRLRSIEVVAPLLVGWYLGKHPDPERFVLPFSIGLIATAVGAWMFRKVPGLPSVVQEERLLPRLHQVWKVLSVRRFLAFIWARSFVAALSTTFWVVMLTARGLPVSYFVWLGAISALGNVFGLRWWGRLVDEHGGRPAITITVLPQAALGIAWLFLPNSGSPLLYWAGGFYLIWGALEGGLLMGQTSAMMSAIPNNYQAEAFAFVSYAGAVSAMLGGLLGGVFFQHATNHSGGLWGIDSRQLYLAGTQILFLGSWWASTRLPGYAEQTPVRKLVKKVLDRIPA